LSINRNFHFEYIFVFETFYGTCLLEINQRKREKKSATFTCLPFIMEANDCTLIYTARLRKLKYLLRHNKGYLLKPLLG